MIQFSEASPILATHSNRYKKDLPRTPAEVFLVPILQICKIIHAQNFEIWIFFAISFVYISIAISIKVLMLFKMLK